MILIGQKYAAISLYGIVVNNSSVKTLFDQYTPSQFASMMRQRSNVTTRQLASDTTIRMYYLIIWTKSIILWLGMRYDFGVNF